MSILKRAPKPRLDPNDPGYEPIEFQFIPERFTRDVNAVYAERAAFGRDHPVMQYVTQESEVYSFRALLFAHTTIDSIKSKVDALIGAVRANPQLRRPPIWTFTWGDFIFDDSVVVESIGGIEYGEPRVNDSLAGVIAGAIAGEITRRVTGRRATGEALRYAFFQMRLRHYEPFGTEIPSPSDPDNDTFYHHVRVGDTWEELARVHYGEALKGDLLRRRNPGKEYLTIGETVAVLKPSRFRGFTPTPYSIPLVRTTSASAMRDGVFEARRKARVSHRL